ncbi:MAG: hypothetical protein WCI31_01660 [Prolixibacteraceae bacterium]
MKKQISATYIPFLLTFAGFIAIYSFLNWYYILEPVSDSISKDFTNFWLPFLLPLLPVFVVFLIFLKPSKGNWIRFSWQVLLATICIIPASLLAQSYLETATGKITALDDISHLNQYPKTKYYTLKNYYIDKSNASIYTTCKMINAGWDFQIFVACPVYKCQSDTSSKVVEAWLTKKYFKNIGRLNSGAEHLMKEEKFWKDSLNAFDQFDMNSFRYLERTPHDSFFPYFEKTIKMAVKYDSKQPILLLNPQKEIFEERNGNKLFWLILSFILGNGFFLMILYFLNEGYSRKRIAS